MIIVWLIFGLLALIALGVLVLATIDSIAWEYKYLVPLGIITVLGGLLSLVVMVILLCLAAVMKLIQGIILIKGKRL